jgi:hypothetical protein
MASNEIETLDPAATVDKLNKIAADRALDRRHFITALGMTGAVAGAALMSGCNATTTPIAVTTAGAGQTNILNFLLNLEYLQATLYSFLTGANITSPSAALTTNSGAITGAPAALAVGTPTQMSQQIIDLLNEMYFDEVNHVIGLQSVLGSVAVPRPAINLAAFGAITGSNALSIARLLEDVGVTAYAGAIAGLSTSNATYSGQVLGVESFHSGALRLLTIQNSTTIATPLLALDGLDVTPDDLGSPSNTASGPTASGGFFPTYGGGYPSNSAYATTLPAGAAGYAYSRTTSQVLAILYGSATALATSGTSSGGFFPSGVNGAITTI